MEFVVLESPFATNTIQLVDGSDYEVNEAINVTYARACMHDCLVTRQEAPYASHLIYTQEGVLDDNIPAERKLGIEAGIEIGKSAVRRVFCVDRGFSSGMMLGYEAAMRIGQPCKMRRLGGEWDIGWYRDHSLEALVARMRS